MTASLRRSGALRRHLGPAVIGLALVLGALLRLWVLSEHPPWEAVFSDMGGYVSNADRIFTHRLIPESFFQPIGFAGIMAGLRWLGTTYRFMAVIHVVTSTFTAFLAGRIAARLDGEGSGVLTTVVAALHFSFAYFVGLYMAETLFAFFLTLGSWIAVTTRLRSAGSAIAFALALSAGYWLKGFTLPIVVFSLALMGLALLRAKSRRERWRWFRTTFLVGSIFALQPVAYHELTRRTIGEAQWGPTASGLNLVEGKCPWKRNEDSRGFGWWSPLYVQQNKSAYRKWDHPFTDAKYFQKQGIECIKENPKVLLFSFVHIAELFVRNTLWPVNTDNVVRKFEHDYEDFWMAFTLPGLLFGFARLGSRDRSRRNLFVLAVVVPIFALCVTVYVFKSEIRFRIPFDPLFCVVACCGWVAVARQLKQTVQTLRRR